MKRALTRLIVALVAFSMVIIPASASTPINSSNTVIVLPTTKVANGIPLHIGDDAISGSRLGAFLVLQGIRNGTYNVTVSVPVEYHSVPIVDANQFYTLNRIDMPDVGINVSDEPLGKAVVVAVNFSRVGFNESSGASYFLDRSVEVIFNENTTPMIPKGNYKAVFSTFDGKGTLYVYSVNNVSDETKSIGESLNADGWTLRFLDMNMNSSKLLVEVDYPDGARKPKIMLEGEYYLMYTDFQGRGEFQSYDYYPRKEIKELMREGTPALFVFSPTEFFVGINSNMMVVYNYASYKKVREYHDGDVFKGQWVWDINPTKNLTTLYLHVDPSKGFRRVEVKPGGRLEIPLNWGLSIVPLFERDSQGKVTGVEGYVFVRRVLVKKTVHFTAPLVNVTKNVNSLIINDTSLKALPKDKNVIIVGGWVSNKAWNLLTKVYGNTTVAKIKVEVLEKGYVVESLPNPYNPDYHVIILAGRTHSLTWKAVQEFMASFG
ncbi:S-layer protein [Thermococcus sp.]|uniref:S-layer protein n=1 Tax=Thermococcus sp. TaxID=35749 RepID=UPI00262E18F1|nr:S-layer protein [Thermococcus sp.]